MKTTLHIRGMSCQHCIRAVDTALRKVTGVKDVRVTLTEAIVETDGPPDAERLKEAIVDAGYETA